MKFWWNSWLVLSASTGIPCTFNAHAGTHSCYAVIGASIPREDQVWNFMEFSHIPYTNAIYPSLYQSLYPSLYSSLYPSLYHLYTHEIIPYNISRSMCWCRQHIGALESPKAPPIGPIRCHDALRHDPVSGVFLEETGLNHQLLESSNHGNHDSMKKTP